MTFFKTDEKDLLVPSVSVAIPCFNSGLYLEEAIASVQRQTYTDWEIVIVDDGSTDTLTRDVLRNLEQRGDPQIHIFYQSNSGPAAARNMAIAHATGQYILPLDADDTIEPGYMAQAIPVLDANPEIGIVYCLAQKFGAETGPWGLPSFSYEQMAVDNVIFCTAFFRRTDWETVNGFSQSLVYGMEDYDFWLKILTLGRNVYQIRERLFNYRINKQSRTTRFQEDRASVVATYAEIFRNNQKYFAKYAEAVYEYRFQLERSGVKYWVATRLRRFPFLYALARSAYRHVKKVFVAVPK